MNSHKRYSISSKHGKVNSKQKYESKVVIEDFAQIPVIKLTDNGHLLRKYTEVLSRNGYDGVAMDDLDQCQQDLEKLLCTNAVRIRFFLGQSSQSDQRESSLDKKAYDKTSLKRKRSDEKPKYKDTNNGLRIVKKDPAKFYNENIYQEIPKIALPRNDNSGKFWSSIEPYCGPVNKDDISFLDSLVQECSKEIDMKISEVGEHYTCSWSEDLINEEHHLGKTPAKKSLNADFKKTGLHTIIESIANPFKQKLSQPLLNEPKSRNLVSNVENSDLHKLKQGAAPKIGTCLNKRLLKELVNQGILTEKEIEKHLPEDEIFTEIKKCQHELTAVNEYNLTELKKLKSAVMNDIHCNELKDDLEKIDKEVLELYNNIMITRKRALQDEGKDYDSVFSDSTITEFERKANALLRQQHVLNREINSMTDMSMLY